MRISYRAIVLSIVATACVQGSSGAAEDAKVAEARKPPSVCVGLDQSACGGKSECYWRKASTTKTGKMRRAHCRIKRSATKNAPA
jgi:hypothetical protein